MAMGGGTRLTGFAALSIMGAIAIFSSTMSKSPTLSWYASHLGAGDLEVGTIAAASTVTGIVVNALAGGMSDVYGRRRMLIASGLVFATAPPLYLAAREPWQLIPIRVYHGAATAIFVPVSMAAVADAFPWERGKMMGSFSSATLVGRLLAPAAAGLLVSLQVLAPFQLVYLTCGAFGAAALILASRVDLGGGQRTGEMKKPARRALAGVRSVLTRAPVVLASSAEAAAYFSMGAIEAFFPLLADSLGVERWLTGALMSGEIAIMAAVKPLAGAASDRLGRWGFVALGLAAASLGVWVLGSAAGSAWLAAGLALHGVGMAVSTASTSPLVSESVPEEEVGSGLGVLESIKDVGHASGPVAAGLAAGASGYPGAFLAAAVVPAAAALAALIWGRGIGPDHNPTPSASLRA